MWEFLKISWPIFAIIAGVILFRILFDSVLPNLIKGRRSRKKKLGDKQWRSDRGLVRWLRGMQPDEFEEYIADLFSTSPPLN